MSDGATKQMWSMDDLEHGAGNADEAVQHASGVRRRVDRVPRSKTRC